MPRKQTPLEELGGVESYERYYRAHVQYRNEMGVNIHLRGPDRPHKNRAQADLAQIRRAGAIGKTREEGLEIMVAEAQRIRTGVQIQLEAQIARDASPEHVVDPVTDESENDEPWQEEYELKAPKDAERTSGRVNK